MNLQTYLMIKQAVAGVAPMPGPTQYVPTNTLTPKSSSTPSRSVLNKGTSPVLSNYLSGYSPKTIERTVNSFIPGSSDTDLLRKEVLAKLMAKRQPLRIGGAGLGGTLDYSSPKLRRTMASMRAGIKPLD